MGEHPVRVWRKHRGMTQKQLADAAGMAQSNISMLEVGTLQGTFDNMRAIARALDITLDDLIPWDDEGSPD
jgi:transcriptional regulator with XRE-family HTH domain